MRPNSTILRCAAAALLLAPSSVWAGKTAVGGSGGLPTFVPDLPQVPPTAEPATSSQVFVPDPSNLAPSAGAEGAAAAEAEATAEGSSSAAAASPATPAAVALQIDAATNFCASLPQSAYIVDCMAERLESLSRAMPSSGDLAGARTSLAEAARDLAALARGNADRTLPPATARIPGGTGTRRALLPVNPAREAAVRSQAAVILERTETVLLRSAGAPSTMAGYRRIASAVGSAKTLLRST